MIVLDASALVELLLGTEQGRSIGARIADPTLGLHVPHLADVEVAQTLEGRASSISPRQRPHSTISTHWTWSGMPTNHSWTVSGRSGRT